MILSGVTTADILICSVDRAFRYIRVMKTNLIHYLSIY